MAGDETNYVEWAKRLNERWIVHQGLDARAEAYMDHLAEVDPQRLDRSCRLAYALARQSRPEDPKPWFYAGLFSLATVDEAKEFLRNHWFTLSSIPSLRSELCESAPTGSISEAAREKIGRIRHALTDLLASGRDNPSQQ